MVFSVGASQAASRGFDGLFGPELVPRMEQSSYQILDTRQNGTAANSTVNMFIGSDSSDMEYAASIVTACVDQTVYAIQCTAGPVDVDPSACGPNAVIVTATSGPSEYIISAAGTSTILGTPATGTILETCALASTTAATCTAIIQGTAAGTAVSTSIVETLSGSDYHRVDVQITGGAEKTANPTAICAAKKGAAATLSTKNVAMFALVGVVGIVNFLL